MSKAPIHIVPTFHHDIAYLQPEAAYTRMATDILDKALALMEQDETCTFTVEQASKGGFMNLYQRNQAHCGDELQIMPAGGDMKMPAASALDIVKNLQRYAGIVPKALCHPRRPVF